jgi:hypothetical protein
LRLLKPLETATFELLIFPKALLLANRLLQPYVTIPFVCLAELKSELPQVNSEASSVGLS